MKWVDASPSDTSVSSDELLVAARIERWRAQDRVIVLERRLASIESELSLRDDRLRRLADELLYERDRRREADDLAVDLARELDALRRTLWWRLGRFPRWIRSHLR